MHIKNHSRQPSVRQHRLYVAVPLFMLCAAPSFGAAALETLHGRAVDTGAQQGTIADGEGVLSHSGAIVSLESGNALFAARGIVRVQAGTFDVRGWNGAFDLTLRGDALDVAALTTPVLVRTKTDIWMIPAGMQQHVTGVSPAFSDDPAGWAVLRQPVPLPAHYLQEHLPRARRLFEAALFAPAQPDPIMRPPLAGHVLQFSAARERAEEAEQTTVLNALHRALLDGDVHAARVALSADTAEAALTGASAAALLPELLSLAQHTPLQSLLTPFFVREPDHLLLALLHPSLRGHAWMLPWPDMNTEARIAALMSLPAADHEEQAVPELAVERWSAHWTDVLSQADAPSASRLADAVLKPLEAQITLLERRGYPERARRYAAAIAGVFASHAQGLSPEASATLGRLHAFARGGGIVTEPVTVPVVVSDAESSSSASTAPDADRAVALENAVRALLTDAGCMFTAGTVIRAVTAERVEVENVVVGTVGGDTLISFQYNVATDQVIDIRKDGRTLPYSLPLARYLEWVRGEGR